MSSIKDILLSEFLVRNTTGNQESLRQVMSDLIEENEDFVQLKNLLNENFFVTSEAKEIHKKANELLAEAKAAPSNITAMLKRIREQCNQIQLKQEISRNTLELYETFTELPDIVEKNSALVYTKYYEHLYKCMTYVVAAISGHQGIKSWKQIPQGSFTDLITFVDKEMFEMNLPHKNLMGKWYVKRKYYVGGKAGLTYEGCQLITEPMFESGKIRGGEDSVFIKSDKTNIEQAVSGWGYIVGPEIDKIEELFSNEIITSINANALTIDIQSLNEEIVFSPKDLLTHLLGTKMFIISPYDYIELVNKYFIKKTIFERKKSSRCILCGSVAPLNGKLICNKHFGQR